MTFNLKRVPTWFVQCTGHDLYQQLTFPAKVLPSFDKMHNQIERATKQGERRCLYRQMTKLNPKVYKIVSQHLLNLQKMAQSFGYRSVYDWVEAEEYDNVPWKKLINNQRYKRMIEKHAKKFSHERKETLNKNKIYPWDLGSLPRQKSLIEKQGGLLMSKQHCHNLAKKFYVHLGFRNIFDGVRIRTKNAKWTYATIDVINNKKDFTITQSFQATGAKPGNFTHLAHMVHELGHILQGKLYKDACHNYIAPVPLQEVVPMFIDELFTGSDIVKSLCKEEATYKESLECKVKEDQYNLITKLHLLEFEIKLHDLARKGKLTAKAVGYLYRDVGMRYFGYEPTRTTDHYWQRYFFYLLNSVLSSRTYVLGQVFAQYLLRQFYETSKEGVWHDKKILTTIRKKIVTVCHKGARASWQDYLDFCEIGAKEDIIRFLLDQMEAILFKAQ